MKYNATFEKSGIYQTNLIDANNIAINEAKTPTVHIYNGKWRESPVSKEGLKYNRIDYACMARTFNAVLCNSIFDLIPYENWELISGTDYDKENDCYTDIFQWYIVDSNGADVLDYAKEIVYYNTEYNLYVWGVDHYGTSWDYVLTNLRIAKEI